MVDQLKLQAESEYLKALESLKQKRQKQENEKMCQVLELAKSEKEKAV